MNERAAGERSRTRAYASTSVRVCILSERRTHTRRRNASLPVVLRVYPTSLLFHLSRAIFLPFNTFFRFFVLQRRSRRSRGDSPFLDAFQELLGAVNSMSV